MNSRNYKTPANRHQNALLPPSLDEYVSADNHVRAIDCYVENIDLAELGFKHIAGELTSGQPAYHPKELVKLYIYGYLHKLRSSRHLADESCRNLELMWLLGNLHPSHATIANFRKNNSVALVALNKDFFLLCKGMNLFGANSIAIDGAFFSGNASKGSITSHKQLKKQIKVLEADIVQWQETLEACDQSEEARAPLQNEKEDISETLDFLKAKLNKKKRNLPLGT